MAESNDTQEYLRKMLSSEEDPVNSLPVHKLSLQNHSGMDNEQVSGYSLPQSPKQMDSNIDFLMSHSREANERDKIDSPIITFTRQVGKFTQSEKRRLNEEMHSCSNEEEILAHRSVKDRSFLVSASAGKRERFSEMARMFELHRSIIADWKEMILNLEISPQRRYSRPFKLNNGQEKTERRATYPYPCNKNWADIYSTKQQNKFPDSPKFTYSSSCYTKKMTRLKSQFRVISPYCISSTPIVITRKLPCATDQGLTSSENNVDTLTKQLNSVSLSHRRESSSGCRVSQIFERNLQIPSENFTALASTSSAESQGDTKFEEAAEFYMRQPKPYPEHAEQFLWADDVNVPRPMVHFMNSMEKKHTTSNN